MKQDSNDLTLLIGSGASALQLPTVENQIDRLLGAIEYYDRVLLRKLQGDKYPEASTRFIGNWLRREIDDVQNYRTPDTFAKVLFLKGEIERLNMIKALIDFQFTFEEFKTVTDPRYDAFFAQIMEVAKDGSAKLPGNLNIISWNYDLQVEKSLGSLTNEIELRRLYENKNLIAVETEGRPWDFNQFNFLKLNGSAGICRNIESSPSFEYSNIRLTDRILKFGEINQSTVQFFADRKVIGDDRHTAGEYIVTDASSIWNMVSSMKCYVDNTKQSGIQFAWERSENREKIDIGKHILGRTSHLVCIGYSFPNFNREIDLELIRGLSPNAKVFIVSPEKTIDSVASRLKAIWKEAKGSNLLESQGQLTLNRDTEEFFIPFDWSPHFPKDFGIKE